MKKIRVKEWDGDVCNSRIFLIRCHLSGDSKELREWDMCTPEGKASAKALRHEQAWCVSRNSKEATVATVERARRRAVDVFTEAATGSRLIESYGSWKERSFTMRWKAIGGFYAKERNRTRLEAGRPIRKELTIVNYRQRRWWPGAGRKQWWWQTWWP